ncbi:MAG: cytochrome c biogenesis protein CcsA [Armatimonadota bacterium]|nr:cytochrome c biogenesis protein CcsA [Armatimonadota bacterium]MDR7464316.1 cytochrome c biogenesis protein CcsA [Armatimonadota bacterium]MDR7468926.1 cytochrome c biogenesis protein CcsA [Armatimonadota bacterium]MDR7475034.1 cytochrome c biogenesis protein CcsA [Armatimonadota bacterium]MDR7539521.1 cytochrome c biogenesis protein CcsA [Armatimonadota bacterium]
MRSPATILGAAASVLLAAGLYAGLVASPPDAFQGDYARIMYVHVPSAFAAYLAVGTVFVASLLYLWRSRLLYDHVAHSATELATLFTALALAGGMIWGKPVWGTWWAWDARLVTTAMLFLIFAAALLVRELVEDRQRGARLAAVVGIIGALDVPLIHYSVVWFRTLHQAPSITRGEIKMAPPMVAALLVNLLAFTLLYLYLLLQRVRLERLEAAHSAGIEP